MTSGEILLILVRAAHTLAAATWVGGAITFLVVGRPSAGSGLRSFAWLSAVCGWILVASGLAMTADRLTGVEVDLLYLALLAVKVGLAIAMFLAAGLLAPSALRRYGVAAPSRTQFRTPYVILTLGIGVYVLGAVLSILRTAAPVAR